MKKLTALLAVLALTVAGLSAATPQFFAFEIGAMGSYAIDDGTIGAENPFGVQFSFDDTFTAGFSFAGGNTALLNVTASPVANVNFSMYTGKVNNELGFGTGMGFDFLTKKSSLFTKMGLYLNWLVNADTVADAYDIGNGGVISLGLKAGFGI